MTNEALKVRLMAEAEKAIDALLTEKPANGLVGLARLERLTVTSGQQFQAGVMQALGQTDEDVQDQAGEQNCERCGSRMQRRGRHPRQVVTDAGEIRVERSYYVCPACGTSLFPPGSGVGTGHERV